MWSRWWLLALVWLVASCATPAPPPGGGAAPKTGVADVTFAVRPDPPIAGDETELVFTVRRDDRLIASTQAAADVVVDMPTNPTRPQPVVLDGDGGGHWHTTFTFPRAGGWAASVRVIQPGNEPVEASFGFDVAPP